MKKLTDLKWAIKRKVLALFHIYPPYYRTLKQILKQLKKENYFTGNGWTNLLIKLTSELIMLEKTIPLKDRLFRKYHKITIAEIKEKFGTLRYYTNGIDGRIADEAYKLISKYEHLSAIICENCGESGKLRQTGWIQTMCNKCFKIWKQQQKEHIKKYKQSKGITNGE